MRAQEFDGMYSRREAWVASAIQLVELLAPSPLSPYRRQVQSTLLNAIGLADNRVDNIAAILRQLVIDVDDGLLNTIESQARSVVFGESWTTLLTTFVADVMRRRASSRVSSLRTQFVGHASGT